MTAAHPGDCEDPQAWLGYALERLQTVPLNSSVAAGHRHEAAEALLQAQRLGAPPELIETTRLQGALLNLAEALQRAGLEGPGRRCREAASQPLVQPPGAAEFHTLKELDAWVHPRSLRRYQQWLISGEPFRLRLEGEIYSCLGCLADGNRNLLKFERERDGALMGLRSSECGEGYALEGQTLEPLRITPEPWPTGPAVARVGNSNFAHFLWNELDAVLRVVASAGRLALVQDHDTVLDLGTLAGVERLASSALKERPSVRLGSTLVSRGAREAVLRALREEPLPPLPPERPAPRLLLGVRGPGRRELLNEEDYCVALITAVRQRFGEIPILLDGFTYQRDNQRFDSVRQREESCTARVRRIMEACGGEQLECLSGLVFSKWLQRVTGLRYYITHEGTMQHKIGWLLPEIPGLCLVGPRTAESIAEWHRIQCEDSGRVDVLPVELFAQEVPSMEIAPEDQRNLAFRIVDVEQAVAATMLLLEGVLEPPGEGGDGAQPSAQGG